MEELFNDPTKLALVSGIISGMLLIAYYVVRWTKNKTDDKIFDIVVKILNVFGIKFNKPTKNND